MRRILATLALALTLAGCGGDDPTGPAQTQIRIQNNTASTFDAVLYSDCANPNWGANRLPNGTVITAGASRDFSVTPGCYDIRVETTAGDFAETAGHAIASGQTFTYTVTNF